MKAKWEECGLRLARNPKFRMRTKPLGSTRAQEEAAQEFIERQSQFLFVVVSRIAPAKSDHAFGKRDQAMIRDDYAMGVTTQILEHILGATERWFRTDHPVLSEPLYSLSFPLQVRVRGRMPKRTQHGDHLAFVVERVRDHVKHNKCRTIQFSEPSFRTFRQRRIQLFLTESL
jgi:hypothetical protein